MSGVARVSVVSHPGVRYPGTGDEGSLARAGLRTGDGSEIDRMVDKALWLARGAGGPERPLLGQWVPRGKRVFVLPNLVMHRRVERGETISRFLAKCTNASIVHPLVDHAVEAAGDSGLVSVGSAPLQSCDYAAAAHEAGFNASPPERSSDPTTGTAPMDLRSVVTVWSKYGSLRERHVKQVPTVEVDLGPLSLLDELYQREANVDFRVGDYAPEETLSFHSAGKHIYAIHRDVLESDVIISVPKLKTHEKVGITCAIKGTVGTITRKECLAHYRHGNRHSRGDELSHSNPLRSLAADIADWSFAAPETGLGNVTRVIGKSAFRLARVGHNGIMGGAWPGNDTAWRMALDVARIIRFARPDGSIATEPQRSHLVLVDGIIAGEGEGPLSPSPAPAGIILFSDDPVAADVACARLMGFEPHHIPLLAHAMDPSIDLPLRTWSTCGVQWDETTLPGLDAIPPALGRPFRPSKGWVGAIERPLSAIENG